MTFIKKYWLGWTLFLGFVLRLIGINQSFWLDEAIGALVIRERGLWDIVVNFPKGDNHPPLYYGLLKIWGNLFGQNEVSLRLMGVLFGLLTVWLVYAITKQIAPKNKAFSVLATILMATAPLHIYYSQEARMYGLTGFFASLAVYCFMRMLTKKPKITDFIVFGLAICLLSFTDYVPLFMLPVFWLWGFFTKRKDKSWLIKFMGAHIGLLVLWLFWLPIFLAQSHAGRIFLEQLPLWRDIAGGANLKQVGLVWVKFVLGRISYYNKTLFYSLIWLTSIPISLALINAFLERKKITIIWFWLIVPVVLVFLASFFIPAFIYFRFIFVLPAFYILAAWGITNLTGKDIKIGLMVGVLCTNFIGWSLYVFDNNQQREEWREATAFVDSKIGEGDIVLFANPEPFAPFRLYSKNHENAFGGTTSVRIVRDKTVEKVRGLLQNSSGVFYFRYLQDLMDPDGIISDEIVSSGFSLEGTTIFTGVGEVDYYHRR